MLRVRVRVREHMHASHDEALPLPAAAAIAEDLALRGHAHELGGAVEHLVRVRVRVRVGKSELVWARVTVRLE